MRRRSRAGGEPAKAQRRKTGARKSRIAPKSVRSRGSSAADEDTKVARLTHERDEALARQSATSEILRVISQSPTDVRPVFDSIVLTAARLLRSDLVLVLLCDGATYSHAAVASPDGPFEDLGPTNFPIDPSANFPSRAIVDKKMLHLPDWSLIDLPEHEQKIRKRFGVNSALYLPLLRDGECIGLLTLVGKRPNTFGAAEIAQAESFRDQALIAIENARLFEAEQQRTRELLELLERQTATSEVLRVISSSPSDLDPVFQAILVNATRICEANFGSLNLHDGDAFPVAAMHNVPDAFAELRRREPVFKVDAKHPLRRVAATKQVLHIADLRSETGYREGDASHRAMVDLAGARTMLLVPMLKGQDLIGVITIFRQEVRPFTENQIELVQNFAAQAVIAIENARLLNELRQRTTDLTERTADLSEALEQQTATSEVLQVISSSPGDLEPVFQAMLEKAVRIVEAKFGVLFLCEGNLVRPVAGIGLPPKLSEFQAQRGAFVPPPGLPLARLIETKKVAHMLDDPERLSPASKLGGARSHIAVPMLKEGNVVGAIYIYRQEVKPFTDKQIELVQNFAAQAVIAIENARLLNELRQRTTDLTERTTELTVSLERQTATSEVLQVISSSPGDLQPVFEAMLEKAVRICDAKFGNIYRWDGELMHLLAAHNTPPALAEVRRQSAFRPSSLVQRMVETKTSAQVLDLAADESYTDKHPASVTGVELGGVRTILSVPLVRKNELIGSFSLYRQEVRLFTAKQIELVENFSKQAVIAIENARLLNELRESLQQQTATADVLKVISRSTFDLQTVLNTLLESAARLCEARRAVMFRRDGDSYHGVAFYNTSPEIVDFVKCHPIKPGRHTITARVALERRTIHVADLQADPEYKYVRRDVDPIRTELGVPMFRGNDLVGVIILYKLVVQPFTDKQIELVATFADQAVIAIENVRLFEAEQQRTRELTELLEQQTATSDVLQVISSSPGDLQPVFETMLQNAVRICDAKFGNILSWDGDALHLVATHNIPPAFAELRRRSPFRPGPENPIGRMVATKAVVHVTDLAAEQRYVERRDPAMIAAVELGGIRTFVAVPMLKENELIGALIVYRQEVRPFTDKQIALVTNFAAQAVIAIENARLLNELRQRTDDLSKRTTDLTEALEQQTATSEVLQVISSSPGDLQPVFEAMLEKAARICDATFGNIYRWDGELLHLLAAHNTPPALAEFRSRSAFRPSLTRAMVETKTATHVVDLAVDPSYVEQRTPSTVAAVELGGVRSFLSVPMVKENELIGSFSLYRQEVRPFTEKQIALVTNFAAQAVIAIENARLLNELRQRTSDLTESLEQQTATSDVLRVISNSPADIQPVLETISERAEKLCDAEISSVSIVDGELISLASIHGS